MGRRGGTYQTEHDRIVAASARTYSKLVLDGFQVAINPGGEKNRWVGPEQSPRYPDVIVWKPTSPGSTSGTAHRIEEIETDDSVTLAEAAQWRDYGALGIHFLLVVPRGRAADAARLVDTERVNVNEIWTYSFPNGQVQFAKYR